MTHEVEILTVSAKDLGKMLNLSVRTIWRHDSAGKLPRGLKIGGAKRWDVSEIRAWIEARCPDRETWEKLKQAS